MHGLLRAERAPSRSPTSQGWWDLECQWILDHSYWKTQLRDFGTPPEGNPSHKEPAGVLQCPEFRKTRGLLRNSAGPSSHRANSVCLRWFLGSQGLSRGRLSPQASGNGGESTLGLCPSLGLSALWEGREEVAEIGVRSHVLSTENIAQLGCGAW